METVKFLTGFGGFGGSSIAIVEHCKLLESQGYDVSLYSDEEWCRARYERSYPMSDFSADPDDILVFHFVEVAERPDCRGCYLYVHERSLWDLSVRPYSAFDSVLFVSGSQRAWHGVDGVVVPNPMGGLVSRESHHPPGRNLAGVVGTVQPRKRQHVSIKAALEDGASEVLVFGNFVEPYFSDSVAPLLEDGRVRYMGHYEPERRMEMYNSFDVLYNFSEDESACLVLGECRLLGKPVVKSELLFDYEIVSDDRVAEIWREIIDGSQA